VDGVQGAPTKSRDVIKDLVGRLRPPERLRVLIVEREVVEDGRLELGGAAMRPRSDLLLGQEREEALDEVDPGRSRWSETLAGPAVLTGFAADG